MSRVVGKERCPSCAKEGKDKSGDNLIVYADGNGKYCFACGYTESSKNKKMELDELEDDVRVDKNRFITKKQIKQIREITTLSGKYHNDFIRGINDDTNKFYRVRYEFDQETGIPVRQYYPITYKGEPSGYKIRKFPKDFSETKGVNSSHCDMFGQAFFQNNPDYKYCVITGGEIDALTVFQEFQRYANKKGYNTSRFAVVSPTIGERCTRQIKANYKFFDRFEKIYLALDNDDAGREAMEDIIPCLPKGKVYIVEWSGKDPNEMLLAGNRDQIISNVYDAQRYAPRGLVGSSKLFNRILENANMEKLPLPKFMSELEDLIAGGIPLGKIVNIAGSSGSGKTSIINELVYFWIFNSPYQLGVVSMELDAGEYGEVLLSRHLGKKVALIKDKEDKMDYLTSQEVIEKSNELFFDDKGSDRFMLVDDRDGTVEDMKAKVEELVIGFGCRIIVLDPIQDILDGMSNEEQAKFLIWQKQMIASHNIIFININHVRKSQAGGRQNSEGADLTEEDMQGSSTLFKSGALNIMIMRNKYAEDYVDRNTTRVRISKCRWSGNTGEAGEWYYDNESHTMYDKSYYFTEVNPEAWDEYLRRCEEREAELDD